MQNNLINLENRIITTLSNPNSCLWFPDLTKDLVTTGLKKLEEKSNINEFNYGTARVILNDPNEDIDIAFQISVQFDNRQTLIPIEILPYKLVKEYQKKDVEFYSTDNFVSDQKGRVEILECLKGAFEIIKQVPNLFRTVIFLVKSIHLIQTESDDYDVSFSEPDIPFSIFVSIPKLNTKANSLRVAEAIIHEAMHLQLTLIEEIVPLIISSDKKYFSPWKQEYRNPQGILHALYVFLVITKYLNLLTAQSNSLEQKYPIKKRLYDISSQINQIVAFEHSSGLTDIGRDFVKNIISRG